MLVVVNYWQIRLQCQLRDLKTEVTCYVIGADTSYNLLLGRSWIHANLIVPSTLHQYLKYVDDKGVVKTVFAEKQPFNGVENYFTDPLLYTETTEEPLPDEPDSSNEADFEPENDACYFYLRANCSLLGDSACNNNVDEDDGEWVLNEDVSFEYFCCLDVPETTYSNSLYMPISTTMKTCTYIKDGDGAIFIVPLSQEDQSLIIFDRIYSLISTFVASGETQNLRNSFIMHGQRIVWWKE